MKYVIIGEDCSITYTTCISDTLIKAFKDGLVDIIRVASHLPLAYLIDANPGVKEWEDLILYED